MRTSFRRPGTRGCCRAPRTFARSRHAGLRKSFSPRQPSCLEDDFPEDLRALVAVDGKLTKAEDCPALAEQAPHRELIEEPLGFTVDEIEVFFDALVTRGTVVMVIGRVEPADQDPARAQRI